MNKLTLLVLALFYFLLIQIVSAQDVENKPVKTIAGGVICGKAINLIEACA